MKRKSGSVWGIAPCFLQTDSFVLNRRWRCWAAALLVHPLSSSSRREHWPAAVAASATFNERPRLPPPRGTAGLLNTASTLKVENFLAEKNFSHFKVQPTSPWYRHPFVAEGAFVADNLLLFFEEVESVSFMLSFCLRELHRAEGSDWNEAAVSLSSFCLTFTFCVTFTFTRSSARGTRPWNNRPAGPEAHQLHHI